MRPKDDIYPPCGRIKILEQKPTVGRMAASYKP